MVHQVKFKPQLHSYIVTQSRSYVVIQVHSYKKENWIKLVTEKYKNKYDYSKVDYIDYNTPVIIICPIHGDFLQTPKNHMNGQGCPICGKDYARNYHKGKYSDFIKESEKRFGKKDQSLSIYFLKQ